MPCSYQLITSVIIRPGTCKMWLGCWLTQMCGASCCQVTERGGIAYLHGVKNW